MQDRHQAMQAIAQAIARADAQVQAADYAQASEVCEELDRLEKTLMKLCDDKEKSLATVSAKLSIQGSCAVRQVMKTAQFVLETYGNRTVKEENWKILQDFCDRS